METNYETEIKSSFRLNSSDIGSFKTWLNIWSGEGVDHFNWDICKTRENSEGNITTSCGPAHSLKFAVELVATLFGKEKQAEIKKQMLMIWSFKLRKSFYFYQKKQKFVHKSSVIRLHSIQFNSIQCILFGYKKHNL